MTPQQDNPTEELAAEPTIFLGVDVGKSQLDVALLDADGRTHSKTVRNEASGHAPLVRWIGRFTDDPSAVHVCVEATGGYGVLGPAMARGLMDAGATVVPLGRSLDQASAAAEALDPDGERTLGVAADVLYADQLADARDAVLDRFGRIDALVNAAGGNVSGATLQFGESPFGLDPAVRRSVVDFNLHGTILPTQVFGPARSSSCAPTRPGS